MESQLKHFLIRKNDLIEELITAARKVPALKPILNDLDRLECEFTAILTDFRKRD
jgi:hypothetical protein